MQEQHTRLPVLRLRGTGEHFVPEARTPPGIPSVVPGEVAARAWGVEALVGSGAALRPGGGGQPQSRAAGLVSMGGLWEAACDRRGLWSGGGRERTRAVLRGGVCPAETGALLLCRHLHACCGHRRPLWKAGVSGSSPRIPTSREVPGATKNRASDSVAECAPLSWLN